MAFTEVATLDSDVTISLGGVNRKTNKPNPAKIEGFYLGSKDVASPKAKSGFCKLHFFQTPKGNVGVWGKTDLDRKLATVAPGTMTRASFSSMKKVAGKNDMYVYKVEADAENMIEVAASDTTADPDTDYSDTGVYADNTDLDTDTDSDDPALDALPPTANVARRAATPPTPPAANKAKVEALLAKARSRAT